MGASVSPRLICIRGPQSGHAVELVAQEYTLGRQDGNDIVIKDGAVSRRHCTFRLDADGVYLEDLGSRHGTLVAGKRVARQLLVDDDRISIGRSEFLFQSGAGVQTGTGTVSLEVGQLEDKVDETRELKLGEGLFMRPAEVLAQLETSTRVASGLAALSRISAAIASIGEPEPLAKRLLELLFEVIPASRGGILLLGGDPGAELAAGEFAAVYTWGTARGPERRARLSLTVARQAVRDRLAILENGVLSLPLYAGVKSLEEARVRSVLCVPIAFFQRVLGVLYLDSSRPDARFDEKHLELATAIAGIAALPLELARTRQAAELQAGAAGGDSDTSLIRVSHILAAAEEVSGESAGEQTPEPQPPALGAVAVVFRSAAALHVGDALLLRSALERLPPTPFPRTVLLMDYGQVGARRAGRELPDAWLDRLSLLPPGEPRRLVCASDVPSIARLAAVVAATTLRPRDSREGEDPRAWFQQILLASGLVIAGTTHTVLDELDSSARPAEGGGGQRTEAGAELELARTLAQRVARALRRPATQARFLAPSIGHCLSLDGQGRMGTTVKGALFIADAPDVLAKKIRAAKTDTRASFDPAEELSPELRSLLLLFTALTGEPLTAALERFAGKGYGPLKAEIAEAVVAFVEPIRARRAALALDAGLASEIVRGSAELERSGAELASALGGTPGAFA